MKSLHIGSIIICLALGGCSMFDTGPQVAYRYFPPNTDSGLLCVATCNNSKMLCRQNEEQKYRQCKMTEDIRRLAEENCRLRNTKDKSNSYCHSSWGETCWSPRYTECTESYQECYQNCGGKVEAYTL